MSEAAAPEHLSSPKPNNRAWIALLILLPVCGVLLFWWAYANDHASREFKQYASTALDSVKHLQERRLDGALLYQPRLLQAERDVDAAKRHASTSVDHKMADALDAYLSQVQSDREVQRIQGETFDIIKRGAELDPAAWRHHGKADALKQIAQWDSEGKQRASLMNACRDESEALLNDDFSKLNECHNALSANADRIISEAQHTTKN